MIINLKTDKKVDGGRLKVPKQPGAWLGNARGASVIMVVQGSRASDLQSLLSTVTQPHIDEWIVVSFGNAEIVESGFEEIAQETRQVTLLKTHAMSVPEAWQLAAEYASCDQLLFLDPKFSFSPTTMSCLVSRAQLWDSTRPTVFGLGVRIDDEIIPSCVALADPKNAFWSLLKGNSEQSMQLGRNHGLEPMRVSALDSNAIYIDKTTFWQLQGFDTRLSAWFAVCDLCLKVHMQGGDVFSIPEAYLTPLVPEVRPNFFDQVKSCVLFYEKNYSKESLGYRYGFYLLFVVYGILIKSKRGFKYCFSIVQELCKKLVKRKQAVASIEESTVAQASETN